MPYTVKKTDACPPGKPWGVVNENTGAVNGRCHATKADAIKQLGALASNVPDAKSKAPSESWRL